jgi:hypothetical protein
LRPDRRYDEATPPNARAVFGIERDRIDVGLGLLHMGEATRPLSVICRDEGA